MSRLIAVSLALLAAVGCVTETGNPELQVGIEGRNTRQDVQIQRSAPFPRTVDAAWVNLEDLRLVEGEVCDAPGEVEHDFQGGAVSLTDGPTLWTGRVPAAEYCRFRIDLDASDGDGPPELLDQTVWVTGSLADGTPFEIASPYKGRFDLRSKGEPIPLGDGVDAVIVAFDLGVWLADLPLETGALTGGTVLVDEAHNPALLAQFEAALEASVEVFDDPDGDGRSELDDDPIAD